MKVDRFSITMDPDLGAAVREAAERQQTSVSAWMAAAASDRLRNELLGRALDRWEAADGPFSEGELDAAAVALGIVRTRRAS
jgi:predicted transcriptional regulator